jgi:hypothetical protein
VTAFCWPFVAARLGEQFSHLVVSTSGDQQGCSVAFERGSNMCGKCVEIDKTIERYRKILLSINDQVTIDRIKELIADLAAQKAALHPQAT